MSPSRPPHYREDCMGEGVLLVVLLGSFFLLLTTTPLGRHSPFRLLGLQALVVGIALALRLAPWPATPLYALLYYLRYYRWGPCNIAAGIYCSGGGQSLVIGLYGAALLPLEGLLIRAVIRRYAR